MTDLATLVVRLEAEIGKYQSNLEKAEKQLAKFSGGAKDLLGDLAGAIAGYFTVDALKEWGEHVLENADHLGKLSQSSGIAVENLSRLKYGLEASGVSGDALGGILKKLNENISEAAGNAKSDAAVAFRALGVEVKDASGKVLSADVILSKIADRFASYADGANKSALATALLGKQGETAIPFLNQGADGIKRLADESDRLGNTVSGKTAKAAEEFNDRVGRLKTTLVEGIGNQVAEKVLPVLNGLGAEFEDDATKLEAMSAASDTLVTGLKLLVSVGLAVGAAFEIVGTHLGAMAAAQEEFFSGNFRQAGQILKEEFSDQEHTVAKTIDRLQTIWRDGGAGILHEVQATAQKIKAEAPNLAGGKEAEKASEDAIKKLTELQQQLGEQVATFGFGEAAAIKYRLTIGNLADDVAKAGSKGQELAKSIEAEAEALQKLKDTKEITKALGEVQAQIEGIRGNAADAAIAQFDAKNADLITKLRHEGNVEGEKQLDTLLTLIVAQADFNELNQKAQSIQTDLAATEERLNNSREAGAITELKYQEELSAARQKAAADLAGINAEQQKIADQTGNQGMIDNVKRLGTSIENLKSQADVLAQSIRKGFEESFGDELNKVISGTESAGEAFGNFIDDVAAKLLKLATDEAAQKLFGAIAQSTTTDSGGGQGIFSAIAGLFGGGRATGGPVQAGMAYKINERTANSEYFVPDRSGQVVPAAAMGGGVNVTQVFNIEAPQGTVSRQTQMQIGASAARQLGEASRRNN